MRLARAFLNSKFLGAMAERFAIRVFAHPAFRCAILPFHPFGLIGDDLDASSIASAMPALAKAKIFIFPKSKPFVFSPFAFSIDTPEPRQFAEIFASLPQCPEKARILNFIRRNFPQFFKNSPEPDRRQSIKVNININKTDRPTPFANVPPCQTESTVRTDKSLVRIDRNGWAASFNPENAAPIWDDSFRFNAIHSEGSRTDLDNSPPLIRRNTQATWTHPASFNQAHSTRTDSFNATRTGLDQSQMSPETGTDRTDTVESAAGYFERLRTDRTDTDGFTGARSLAERRNHRGMIDRPAAMAEGIAAYTDAIAANREGENMGQEKPATEAMEEVNAVPDLAAMERDNAALDLAAMEDAREWDATELAALEEVMEIEIQEAMGSFLEMSGMAREVMETAIENHRESMRGSMADPPPWRKPDGNGTARGWMEESGAMAHESLANDSRDGEYLPFLSTETKKAGNERGRAISGAREANLSGDEPLVLDADKCRAEAMDGPEWLGDEECEFTFPCQNGEVFRIHAGDVAKYERWVPGLNIRAALLKIEAKVHCRVDPASCPKTARSAAGYVRQALIDEKGKQIRAIARAPAKKAEGEKQKRTRKCKSLNVEEIENLLGAMWTEANGG